MPTTHENDKGSSIANPEAVRNAPKSSSGGEGGSIAFHRKDSGREKSRGSHLAHQRSAVVNGDDRDCAVNAPSLPLPRLLVACSDHVQDMAHSKERDDWRNRRSLLTTHDSPVVPGGARVGLGRLGDDIGDIKNDTGVFGDSRPRSFSCRYPTTEYSPFETER